ncbi:MAG: sigma-54-dependent Fis family transcriptional regulator [Oligoflexia bacterium]|nr:sigma-54-dependent Fis family transcriptional regulator [Oligoflexia bacterium]MBF0364897.1 sigma-54-dependent Fis family transcriptional regulator [Oligoflexia bacterium]
MFIKQYPTDPLLIVDRDVLFIKNLSALLGSVKINNIIACQEGEESLAILAKRRVSLVLLDTKIRVHNHRALLNELHENFPETKIIAFTESSSIDDAIECMKLGVHDYFSKPPECGKLIVSIQNLIDQLELAKANTPAAKEQSPPHKPPLAKHDSSIIYAHQKMFELIDYTASVATSSHPVLITGETGVGKEVFANLIHKFSKRKGKLVAINISGLDENIITDTLFGHKKGAYTNADSERKGLIEEASGGTLFLDEIGDLNPSSQLKLLRLIQENEYYPLGYDRPKYSTARIVTATNQDLKERMQSGLLRKDLYYRLQTHEVQIPPLRERIDDVPLLVQHFAREYAKLYEREVPNFSHEALQQLMSYHYPGNVRELRSMVFDIIQTLPATTTHIESLHLRGKITTTDDRDKASASASLGFASDLFSKLTTLPHLKSVTNALIKEAMKRANHKQQRAASMIGITQQALSKRLKKEKTHELPLEKN